MQENSSSRYAATKSGFTLVELMITVSIVAILATLAIPAFNSYLYRTRAQEATDFINVIRLRQESYRSEFGQYCNVNKAHPDVTPGPNAVAWSPIPTEWQPLGANPDGWVRFRYFTTAGFPGTTPSDNTRWNLTGDDFWYVVTAEGDLDDDQEYVTFGTVSGKRDIWCSSSSGWE